MLLQGCLHVVDFSLSLVIALIGQTEIRQVTAEFAATHQRREN